MTIMAGGFFYENIRKMIIEKCMETQSPEDMFFNIRDVVSSIEDEVYSGNKFWERVEQNAIGSEESG